jgi:Ras-related protein Rab-37
MFYRNAHAFLLLYDVTSYSSFENITNWLNEIKRKNSNDMIMMLIGNKVDKSQRVVSRAAGERLARQHQMSFLETSAKTGQNVELAFMITAQVLLDQQIHSSKLDEHICHNAIQLHRQSYRSIMKTNCCL